MNFDLIKRGLQTVMENDAEQAAEAKHAIAEINEIQQRLGEYDRFWKGECYVLAATTVSDICIEYLYDTYGKLHAKYKDIDHAVPFNEFEQETRRGAFEFVPLSFVQTGYEVIADLYKDNEANDCHNADGTFRK